MTKRYFSFPKKTTDLITIHKTIERIKEFCFELENEKNFLLEIEKLEKIITPEYKIVGLSRMNYKINELFNKTIDINEVIPCLKLILKLSNIGPKIFNKTKNKSLNNYELFEYKDFEFNTALEMCKNILIHEESNKELIKLACLILITFNQNIDIEINFEDILFVYYIFCNSNKQKIKILKKLSSIIYLSSVENIELFKIGLGKINKYEFLANELSLIKEKNITYEILMIQKNHKTLQKLITKFDFNQFSPQEILEILINTMGDNNLFPTLSFLEHLLETNENADLIIQQFIIKTNKHGVAPLILKRDQFITEDFILCCLISDSQLNFLNSNNASNILENKYFRKFSNDFVSYKIIIEKAFSFTEELENISDKFIQKRMENQLKIAIKYTSKDILIKTKQIHFLVEKFRQHLSYFQENILFLVKKLNQTIMPELLQIMLIIRNTKFVEILVPFLFKTNQELLIDFIFSIEEIYISRFIFSSIKFINLNFSFLLEKEIYLEKLSSFKLINENINYWNAVAIKNMKFEKFQNHPEFLKFIKKETLNINETNYALHEEFKKKLKLDLATNMEYYTPLIEYNESSLSLFTLNKLIEIIKQNAFNYAHEKTIKNKMESKIERLIELSKYKNGLVFYESFLYFKINSTEFSCYLEIFQYDCSNKQEIIKLSNEKEIFKLYISNGNIKYEIKNIYGKETINLNILNTESFKVELKYKNKKLKVIIGNCKIIENFEKINNLQIGKFFRGIISNILIFECIFEKPILFKEGLYREVLDKIEKKLRYNAKSGIFMDSNNFLQLSYSPMKVSFDNILNNKNFKCEEELILLNEILEKVDFKGVSPFVV